MTGNKRLFFLAVMCTLLFVLGACSSDDPATPQNSSTPAITGFSPASGAVGDTVTITGTGFSTTPASNTVAFNGTPATVASSTSTQIVVTVPAGATSGTITVTVGGVTATSSSTFTVTSGSGTAGALDTTFGGGAGYVTTTIDGMANAIAIQADGKILVAGSGTGATVVRYNTDGTLDTGFGTAGSATLPAGSSELSIINSLALDGSGKIVVAGIGTSGGFFRMAAARLNANGSIDTTFGVNGVFYSPFTSNGSYGAKGMAIQGDGSIVLAGVSGSTDRFTVVRLTSAGALDTTFGSPNGYVTTVIQDQSHALGVAIQGDGKIVVMGQSYLNSFTNFAATVARYNADGTLDTTFGNPNGYVADTRLNDPQALALQSGKIVVAGGAVEGPIYQFAMLRFGTDGIADSTFGTTGLVTTPVGGAGVSGEAYSLALTSNGIILAGHVGTTPAQIGVARYSSNGVLDTTFGTPDGYVLTSIGTSPYPYASAIDGNGKIVVTGGQGSGTAAYFVARYLP